MRPYKLGRCETGWCNREMMEFGHLGRYVQCRACGAVVGHVTFDGPKTWRFRRHLSLPWEGPVSDRHTAATTLHTAHACAAGDTPEGTAPGTKVTP